MFYLFPSHRQNSMWQTIIHSVLYFLLIARWLSRHLFQVVLAFILDNTSYTYILNISIKWYPVKQFEYKQCLSINACDMCSCIHHSLAASYGWVELPDNRCISGLTGSKQLFWIPGVYINPRHFTPDLFPWIGTSRLLSKSKPSRSIDQYLYNESLLTFWFTLFSPFYWRHFQIIYDGKAVIYGGH